MRPGAGPSPFSSRLVPRQEEKPSPTRGGGVRGSAFRPHFQDEVREFDSRNGAGGALSVGAVGRSRARQCRRGTGCWGTLLLLTPGTARRRVDFPAAAAAEKEKSHCRNAAVSPVI